RRVWMEEIKVWDILDHQLGRSRAGTRIFRGVQRNIQRRQYGLLNRFFTQIRGRGAAFTLTTVDGNAKRAITVELDIFDFTQTSRDTEPGRLSDRDFRSVGLLRRELERFGT